MSSWWNLIARQIGADADVPGSAQKQVAFKIGAVDSPGLSWESKIASKLGVKANGFRSFTGMMAAATMLAGMPQGAHTRTLYNQFNSRQFYISVDGNDNSDGRSVFTPWQTIAKVNAHSMQPGDAFFFRGGDTFVGNVLPNSGGTTLLPITFSSYGLDRSVITPVGVGGYAIYFEMTCCGIVIKNLNLVGSGEASQYGVYASNWNGLVQETEGIVIEDVTATNFYTGIYIEGSYQAPHVGYTNVIVRRCTVSGCDHGIHSWSENPTHSNFTIENCLTYNCINYGIILSSCLGGGIVQNCVAYGIGSVGTPWAASTGIQVEYSTGVIVQLCESYNNTGPSGIAGFGIGLGSGNQNCVAQYNYTHGNRYGGYTCRNMVSFTWANNTFRYNISENDAQTTLETGSVRIITHTGAMSGLAIYGNTFYKGVGDQSIIYMTEVAAYTIAGTIANNILFSGVSATPLIRIANNTSDVVFRGNNYYNAGAFHIHYGATDYTTYSAWQTATNQEKISGNNVGLTVEPILTSFGNSGIWTPLALDGMIDYIPQAGSPMIGAGLDLTQFGITDPGARDFFGNALNPADLSIGAHSALVV